MPRVRIHVLLIYTQLTPVCSGKLKSVDLYTGLEVIPTGDIILRNTITFTNEHLRDNRHYNVTITATNVAGSANLYITISEYIHTHKH